MDTPALPAAEIIEPLPDVPALRAELERIDAQRDALMVLLRAALKRDRGRERAAAVGRQEVPDG